MPLLLLLLLFNVVVIVVVVAAVVSGEEVAQECTEWTALQRLLYYYIIIIVGVVMWLKTGSAVTTMSKGGLCMLCVPVDTRDNDTQTRRGGAEQQWPRVDLIDQRWMDEERWRREQKLILTNKLFLVCEGMRLLFIVTLIFVNCGVMKLNSRDHRRLLIIIMTPATGCHDLRAWNVNQRWRRWNILWHMQINRRWPIRKVNSNYIIPSCTYVYLSK